MNRRSRHYPPECAILIFHKENTIKRFYILAGANGSGKSTIARVLLPAEGIVYVNPDDIARDLNPGNPVAARIEAGREALRRIDALIGKGESFAIESTLSGSTYVKVIEWARSLAYTVVIAYIFVDSPEVCIARIAARVRNGGHYIPDDDVRRRYVRSKGNFVKRYAPVADSWSLFYNGESQIVYVARGGKDSSTAVFSKSLYGKFLEGL